MSAYALKNHPFNSKFPAYFYPIMRLPDNALFARYFIKLKPLQKFWSNFEKVTTEFHSHFTRSFNVFIHKIFPAGKRPGAKSRF